MEATGQGTKVAVAGDAAAAASASADAAGAAGRAAAGSGAPGVQEATRRQVQAIPLLRARAGPRDAAWPERLKEEYVALIAYVKNNKQQDLDWFTVSSNQAGTKWSGQCWHYHDNLRYEFEFDFELPVGYPQTPPEVRVPGLEGKTIKMYHGGKICLTVHFNPLWTRNVPRFGIAHALALGLGPWLAAEVPDLVKKGLVLPK
jgi:ufm1-conjugating enzyme 1